MSYVPTGPASARDASPRARELARQLEQVIDDFQRSYPDTKPADVRQAVQIASGTSASVPATRRRLVLWLATGLAVLIGGLVFLSEGDAGPSGVFSGPLAWVLIGGVVLVALALLNRSE